MLCAPIAKQKQLRVEYSRNSQSLTASPGSAGELPVSLGLVNSYRLPLFP